jgi:hypothetical protein
VVVLAVREVRLEPIRYPGGRVDMATTVSGETFRIGGVVDHGHVALYASGGQIVVAPTSGEIVNLRLLVPWEVQIARVVV